MSRQPHPDGRELTRDEALTFQTLVALGRPSSTSEIAAQTGRHVNSVRAYMRTLAEAGLVEQSTQQPPRGRPRDLWAVPAQLTTSEVPGKTNELMRWLATALEASASIEEIEEAGRKIGVELFSSTPESDTASAFQTVLRLLGYQPAPPTITADGSCHVLGYCPHRNTATTHPQTVCALHRGVTRGVLEQLDPEAGLTAFEPKDPRTAGCVIKISFHQGPEEPRPILS